MENNIKLFFHANHIPTNKKHFLLEVFCALNSIKNWKLLSRYKPVCLCFEKKENYKPIENAH